MTAGARRNWMHAWVARASALLALSVVWLPRVVVPAAAAGCNCAERGSPVTFDAATVARNPTVVVEGAACNAESVECVHRDAEDRCDTFWIVPIREGHCIFSVRFDDGTRIEDDIEYDHDDDYPCRGNVRPRRDHVTRITSS